MRNESVARKPECPPPLHLEQASAGDWLPGVKDHVAGCSTCTEQVASLQKLSADFIAARPVDRFLKQLDARPAKPRRSPAFIFAMATAMSALILFTLTALLSGPRGAVTMKGSLAHITMKRGENLTTLSDDTKLAPGDALRFSVTAPAEGFAVVLERDSTGKVTVVAPFGAKEPKAVNQGTNVLPDSAVLDDVRGRETFFTVFSESTFDVQKAIEAVEQQRSIDCDCIVDESTYEKP